ncbi:hypothetical protein D3C73_1472510 [compost metagenome]
MAVEEASFNTEILAIVLEEISPNEPLKGIPSKMIKGLLEADMEFSPRILIAAVSPGLAFPELIARPEILPCSLSTMFGELIRSRDLASTVATLPVRSLFFCLP